MRQLSTAASRSSEHYWWINGIAIALSAMIAVMSFRAYGEAGAPMKAWVCVTCQALAIALAILARRAFTGAMPSAGAAAGVGALGCAWWASHGLALAWAQNGDNANGWMVLFLTALEPALFLLAEHIREGRMARRDVRQPPLQQSARARAATALVALGAAGFGAGGAAALAQEAHQPVAQTHDMGTPMKASRKAAAGGADATARKDAARALLAQGRLSHRAIAAQVGLSARTVDRLAAQAGA